MIVIIGLGNPGEKFKNTRHNVGFMVLDKFAKENDFPEFELQKKFDAKVSEGVIGEEKIILAKPQTFMNDSGKTTRKILENNKSQINNLIVVHDDVDLPIGKIKIIKERGSAGHKGVESIIKNIGNEGLVRFRVGVGAPSQPDAMKIVLENFSEGERQVVDETIQKVVNALDLFLKAGLDGAMNEYNK